MIMTIFNGIFCFAKKCGNVKFLKRLQWHLTCVQNGHNHHQTVFRHHSASAAKRTPVQSGRRPCNRLADNLAPDPIWHRSQFGTTQKEYILLLCTVETWKLFATNIILLFWEICLNPFSNPHFKSNPKTCTLPKFWQKRSSIEKVAHSTLCKCFPLFWARKGPQTQKQTVPSSNVGNKSPVLKRFPFTWAR